MSVLRGLTRSEVGSSTLTPPHPKEEQFRRTAPVASGSPRSNRHSVGTVTWTRPPRRAASPPVPVGTRRTPGVAGTCRKRGDFSLSLSLSCCLVSSFFRVFLESSQECGQSLGCRKRESLEKTRGYCTPIDDHGTQHHWYAKRHLPPDSGGCALRPLLSMHTPTDACLAAGKTQRKGRYSHVLP